jgi:hypothetical protein
MSTLSRTTFSSLFLAVALSACGAPEMEDESENAAAPLLKPCLKGEPCGPIVPLPPPPPKPNDRTYCCDYGTVVTWVVDRGGKPLVTQVEGFGCRNLEEAKDKSCRLDLQVTCNAFRVERLEGGHLICVDPF